MFTTPVEIPAITSALISIMSPPEYVAIKEGAAKLAAADAFYSDMSDHYRSVNTYEAHEADDYEDPTSVLNVAIRHCDDAYRRRQAAHDDLAVSAAWLVLTDNRLRQKLADRMREEQRMAVVAEKLLREMGEELKNDA